MIKYRKQFNRSRSSSKKRRPGKDLLNKKKGDTTSTPLLKSWRSWPGFLLVACEGLSRLYREITNSFFNISWVPKHQVCRNPTGGNTLSLGGPHEKVPQSHTKFMQQQLFFTRRYTKQLSFSISRTTGRRNEPKLLLCCGSAADHHQINPHTSLITWDIWTRATKAIRQQERPPLKHILLHQRCLGLTVKRYVL